MEADGREPVWPPHASNDGRGNAGGRRLVALQSVRSPMQHDGVSSSQVDSSENHSHSPGLAPGSPHLSGPHGPSASYQGAEAQAWVPDNEPESTVNEARPMTVPSPAQVSIPQGIISIPSSGRSIPRRYNNEAMAVASSTMPDSSIATPPSSHIENRADLSSGEATPRPPSNQPQMSIPREAVSQAMEVEHLPNNEPRVSQPAAVVQHVPSVADEIFIRAATVAQHVMIQPPVASGSSGLQQQQMLVQPTLAQPSLAHEALQPFIPPPAMIQPSALIQQAIQGVIPASVQSDQPQQSPEMINHPAGQPTVSQQAPLGEAPESEFVSVPTLEEDDEGGAASDGGIEVSLTDAEGASTSAPRRPGRRSAQNVQNLVDAEKEDITLMEDVDAVDEEDFLKQGAIQKIVDRPITSRARATLPSMLQVFKVQNEEVGVFAKRSLPKRTQFGPLEGYIVHESPQSGLKWAVIRNGETVYIDCTDEYRSNWMGFVRPAQSFGEQNLMAFCLDNEIYFATIKTIEPRQELKVWYAKSYAESLGEQILEITPEEAAALQEKEKTWPCFECSRKFKTSELLQKHLSTHEEDVKPPRGRGRGRGKGRGRPRKRGRPKKYPSSDRNSYKNAGGRSVQFQEKPNPFTCGTCGKVFTRNYDLQRHASVHIANKAITCEVCYKKFAHDYNALRHLRKHKERGEYHGFVQPPRHRQVITTWLCEYCDESFSKEELLVAHEGETHAEEAAQVPSGPRDPAGMAASQAGILPAQGGAGAGISTINQQPANVLQPLPGINNLQVSFPSDVVSSIGEASFSQSVMGGSIISQAGGDGMNFTSQGSSVGGVGSIDAIYSEFTGGLPQQSMSMNAQGQTLIHCKVCGKTFDNQSLYNAHVKVHMIPKFYKCPFCEIGYEKPELLRRHVTIHRQDGRFYCPHCADSFEMYSHVRKHIREQHSCKEFPCPGCDKIFPRPDKLKMHMLKHTDRKDFLCANCGKQFKRRDKLKEHMLRMHNPEREAKMAALAHKPKKIPFRPAVDPTEVDAFTFKCRACQLGFKRRGMLVNHLARQHPEIQPESVPELNLPIIKPNRNYFCAYCEKVYKSSSKRKIHILKNHPGSLLPPSLRKNRSAPETNTLDDPHTAPAGSTTTHYFACAHCPRQYSTKAKMMDHVRKKHMDPVASGSLPTQQISVVEPVHVVAQVDEQNSVPSHQGGQIMALREANSANNTATQVVTASLQGLTQGQATGGALSLHQPTVQLVVAPGATPEQISAQIQEAQAALSQERIGDSSTIRYIDISQLAQAESTVQATDVLNQAMSELQHSIGGDGNSGLQSVSELVQRIFPQIQQQQQQQQNQQTHQQQTHHLQQQQSQQGSQQSVTVSHVPQVSSASAALMTAANQGSGGGGGHANIAQHIQIPASLAQQFQGAQIVQQPGGQVMAISADGTATQAVDVSQLIQIGPAAQSLTQAAMAALQQQQIQGGGGNDQGGGRQIQGGGLMPQLVQIQNLPQVSQQGQQGQSGGAAISSQADRQAQQTVILPAGWSYGGTQFR